MSWPLRREYCLRRFRVYLPSILAAILLGTSYIPFYPWALPFCLTPLFAFVLADGRNERQVFIATWITFSLGSAIGFHWLPGAVQNYSNSSRFYDYLVYLLYVGLSTLPLALAAFGCTALCKDLPRKAIYLSLLIPLSFYFSQVYIPIVFQWNLGYPWFYARSPIFQITQLLGINGLSLVTYLSCSLLALILLLKRQVAIRIGVLTFFWLVLLFFGAWLKGRTPPPERDLPVLIVQPNVSTNVDLALELGSDRDTVFHSLTVLTERGLKENPGAELIAWPETAFPGYPQMGGEMVQQLEAFIRREKRPLITGAYAGRPGSAQNAVFYFNAEGVLQEPPYSKIKTFPLAESGFAKTRDLASNNGVVEVPKARVGVDICYEGLFSEITRARVENGAQYLFNFTDDSWFNSKVEAVQNFYMTLADAVEAGRSIVRISNSGISGFARPDGRVQIALDYGKSGYALIRVPAFSNRSLTYWARYQRWIRSLILLIFVSLIGLAGSRRLAS